MKNYILLFLLTGSITFSFAQSATQQTPSSTQKKQPKTRKTPEQKAESQTKKMTEELSLTSEQVQKVQDINLQTVQQLDVLKAQEKDVREKKNSALKQVLTPEQYNTYILSHKRNKKTQTPTSSPGNSNPAGNSPAIK